MRKLKITSLILVVVMLLGMLPLGMLATSAATTQPATLPDGENYFTKTFMSYGEGTALNALANDAQGIMYPTGGIGVLLTMSASEAGTFNLYAQMQTTPAGYGTSSWPRFYTDPSTIGYGDRGARMTYAYLWNGEQWLERGLSNLGSATNLYVSPSVNTSDDKVYVYVPFDTFRYYGPGNGSLWTNTSSATYYADEVAEMKTLVGMGMDEFMSRYEDPRVKFQIIDRSSCTAKLYDISIVYAADAGRPSANAVSTAAPLKGTVTTDTNATNYPNYANSMANGALTVQGMATTSTDAARSFLALTQKTNMSDMAGIRFTVDTSALGSAQLELRARLQRYSQPAGTPYADGVIYNAYDYPYVSQMVDGVRKDNIQNNYHMYEKFSSANNGTGLYGGYVQFTTRTGGSYAFYDGTVNGEPVSGVLHTYGTTYWKDVTYQDAFKLPAGFVGEVYIPMESYYLNVYGSYASPLLINFRDSLMQDIDAICFYSSVSGTPSENKVVYSNIEFVSEPDNMSVVEIGTAQQLLDFANAVGNGTTYANTIIRLTNDIVLNEGKDVVALAKAGNVSGLTAWGINKGDMFAGIFDGQGHTISGIYLKGTGAGVGIFGNVNTRTQATVKNVAIINSYVENSAEGTGGIFGIVYDDAVTAPQVGYHRTATHATIENVYMGAYIYQHTYKANGWCGVGGFIGGVQSDVTVKDSVFAGDVLGSCRGVAAFFGAIRSYQDTYNKISTEWYVIEATIENCVSKGSITMAANGYGFMGVLAGYVNDVNTKLTVDGLTSITTVTDNTTSNAYEGMLIGGSWCGADAGRAQAMSGLSDFPVGGNDYFVLRMTNSKYVANGNVTRVVGNATAGMKYTYVNSAVAYTNSDVNNAGKGDSIKTTLDALPEVLMIRDGAKLQQNVALAENITYNISVKESDVITKAGTLTATVDGSAKAVAVNDGRYIYSFADILPQEMDQTFAVSITGNGKTVSVTGASVEAYLVALTKSAAQTQEAKDLAYDLLAYGAAAQSYVGMEVTIGDGVTIPAAQYTVTDPGDHISVPQSSVYQQVALRLENGLMIQVRVSGGDTFTAMIGSSEATAVKRNSNVLVAINAADLGKIVTITDASGVSMTVSANDYIYHVLQAGGLTASAETLLKAIYEYGQSASAYVNA